MEVLLFLNLVLLFLFFFFFCLFIFVHFFLLFLWFFWGFFCFVIVSFLFLFLFLLSFFFLYYQLYHDHILTHFTLPLSPVLKSYALLPNNLFSPFSPTLTSSPHLPLLFFSNLSQGNLSLLHTHHPLINILYQLYTTPTPAITNRSTIYYSNRNIPQNTQEPQKPAAPVLLPPLTKPTSCPPINATLSNSPNFYN
jgi:hypothetical protein